MKNEVELNEEKKDIEELINDTKEEEAKNIEFVQKVDGRINNVSKRSGTGIILVMCILLSFVCGMIGAYLISQTVSVEQVVKNITTSELVENSISSSVDKVYNSTVAITASANGKAISTGTGFIYKKSGKLAYIMTNNHVIEGADQVSIEFTDSEKKIDAKIVGGDKYADIAVLTIPDNDEYKIVEVGDNDSLKLGDTIFTVGTPMGVSYKGTVTKGILSGKDRMVEVNVSGSTADYYMKVIQIDAAVNPGNSGGPLCDVSGKVIGVISLKIVEDRVEGMGFAIPIEDALKYAETIETGGEIVRPYIGISMLDLTEEYYLWQNRVTIPDNIDEGVAIVSVEKNSPADKAGLKKNDIIVELGGETVSSIAEFRYELYKHDVGEKVSVTFFREGKMQTTTITLGKNQS